MQRWQHQSCVSLKQTVRWTVLPPIHEFDVLCGDVRSKCLQDQLPQMLTINVGPYISALQAYAALVANLTDGLVSCTSPRSQVC